MFSLHPAIISGSKSDAMARMPISAASMTMPPVPQNGSRTVPPRFTPVRLISARAYLGWSEMGEKNGRSPTLRFSRRSVSVTLCSRYRWTVSHICILMMKSGSRRFTSLFFERIPPILRTMPWESASFIIPSNLFPRTAKLPSGSSAFSRLEMLSGSYSPRYLPMLLVSAMRSAIPSSAFSSNSAMRYPGPCLMMLKSSASASMQRIASAGGMSLDSPDSSKKNWGLTPPLM